MSKHSAAFHSQREIKQQQKRKRNANARRITEIQAEKAVIQSKLSRRYEQEKEARDRDRYHALRLSYQ